MRALAALVHVFTALGAVAALMALLAVADQRWEVAFVWLGIGFIIDGIDGIDGPFVRAVRIDEQLPRFSGERIDLVVDYLTYVFVPAFALISGGYLTGTWGLVLAAGILLSSLFHFSDQESKAEDNSFVGFPAIWNIVAFYIFVMQPDVVTAQVVILALIALTFTPTKWVHPVRVAALQGPTLLATGIWALAAVAATWIGFGGVPMLVKAALWGVAFYGIGLTIWTSMRRQSPC